METDDLHQQAVLWVSSGFNNFGKPKVNAGVEINVRWEASSKEVNDPDGNSIILDAEVVVNQIVPVHSILWLGLLTDLPSPTTNLMRVESISSIPDMKNRVTRRTLGLKAWKDSLPDLN